jgi:hypothetical protein
VGEDPYIHFHIYPDRIVVDSNEDSFTEADVRAICHGGVGTSAKTTGYIGGKGIGFKSVFKIASKVHIQSGPFSFVFKHNLHDLEGEDYGIGMVCPIPGTEYELLPSGVSTRITLTLMDPSKFEDRVNDANEVPDTFALFLSKLKRISFSVTDSNGHRQDVTYSCAHDTPTSSARLTKVVNDIAYKYSYKITRKTVSDSPEEDNRGDQSEAEVVLAFPVGEDSAPIAEPQYVFSFLPMRKVGFKVCQYTFPFDGYPADPI